MSKVRFMVVNGRAFLIDGNAPDAEACEEIKDRIGDAEGAVEIDGDDARRFLDLAANARYKPSPMLEVLRSLILAPFVFFFRFGSPPEQPHRKPAGTLPSPRGKGLYARGGKGEPGEVAVTVDGIVEVYPPSPAKFKTRYD